MGLLSLGTPLPWADAKQHADHNQNQDHLLWGDEVEYMIVAFDHSAKTVSLSLNAQNALENLEKLEVDAKSRNETFSSSWKPEYGRYMLEGTPGSPYGSTLKHLLDVEPNMVERRKLAKSYLSDNEECLTLTSFPHLGSGNFLFGASDPSELRPDLVNSASRSLFIPDAAINPHARFSTLTRNIRQRRGAKVFLNIPIFKDIYTPNPFKEKLPECLVNATDEQFDSIRAESNSLGAIIEPVDRCDPGLSLPDVIPDAKPDSIYLDCMCFGMGCSCLQVTFQACSVEEARRLYDQLAVLAITAAAPIFRGLLSDVDCRWDLIAASVDDRTPEERGVIPLNKDHFRIMKSRYDSINNYLSPGPSYSGGCGPVRSKATTVHGDFFKPKYDDLKHAYDKKIFSDLVTAGMDSMLAKHYAHLFIRDPLVIFTELLDQDDEKSSDHFENIQSTNWQTMRFKPPPPSSPNIGWRVEFRSMEIQLTDFENAAFSIFVVLLTRTILSFDLNLYIKLTKVEENMRKAKTRDACINEKFWFRTNIFGMRVINIYLIGDVDSQTPLASGAKHESQGDSCDPDQDVRRSQGRPLMDSLLSNNGLHRGSNQSSESISSQSSKADEDEVELMSINEIINGKEGVFPGLIPLISSYLSSLPLDYTISSGLERYLDLIRQKAAGTVPTTAAWIRQFVAKHPDYKQDSVIGDRIAYDLMMEIKELQKVI